MEQDTNLTKKYRAKYPDWFRKHLHITNIPGFTSVYLHVGNNEKHTAGCVLVADQAYLDPKDFASTQSYSIQGFKDFYLRVCDALDRGEPVTITIGSIGNGNLIFGNHV